MEYSKGDLHLSECKSTEVGSYNYKIYIVSKIGGR